MPLEGDKLREFLTKAKDRLKRCIDADEHNRRLAVDDLRFLNGEQWTLEEANERNADERPMLMVNMLPKFVKQVMGDMRRNRPKIKIRPTDAKGSVDVAKIREGITYDIEYQSNAEHIYDQAGEQQIASGYGAWRVVTEYENERSFNQVIRLKPVPNPFMCYLDPDADQYGDERYGFLLDKMPREDFERKYPKAMVPGGTGFESGSGQNDEHWFDKDTVTVAEYYTADVEKKKIALLSDGRSMEKSEAERAVANSQLEIDLSLEFGEPTPEPLTIVRERDTEEIQIKHYIITASEILEGPKKWPGKYIPLIMVYGEELNIEGKRHIRGLIRFAKDPMKLFNFWYTLGAETIALGSKAPYVGTAKQFAGFENDWKQANKLNFPYLKYNPDKDAPGAPQRQFPTQVPTGIFAQIDKAEQYLDHTTGLFKSAYGQESNEKSGRAILARAQESDTATFAYPDNLARGVLHTGRIINDLIPHIYDTERDARLRNLDDTEQFVPINTTVGRAREMVNGSPDRFTGIDRRKLDRFAQQHGDEAVYNDIAEGEYGVVVTVGPSFATQRMESADIMMKLTQAAPQIFEVAGDLLVKNLDIKDNDELAQRLRKLLPPGLVPPEEGEEEETASPPPSPAEQLEMQKQEFEQLKFKAETDLEAEKLRLENRKLDIEEAKLGLSPRLPEGFVQ